MHPLAHQLRMKCICEDGGYSRYIVQGQNDIDRRKVGTFSLTDIHKPTRYPKQH